MVGTLIVKANASMASDKTRHLRDMKLGEDEEAIGRMQILRQNCILLASTKPGRPAITTYHKQDEKVRNEMYWGSVFDIIKRDSSESQNVLANKE